MSTSPSSAHIAMPTAARIPTRTISHIRIKLALHCLREGDGPILLLLHGLGEQTPLSVPAQCADWPGAVWGLDFTGHGASQHPRGGGYTSEVLMADVDCALQELGPVTILGRGLGGYIGLLIAGARPQLVRGLIIADGTGLAGGGIQPGTPMIDAPMQSTPADPDSYAFIELSTDVRPPDYAVTFVRAALMDAAFETPITIAATMRPPWLAAIAECVGVQEATVGEALAAYR
jgi:pimeloyl-ACP methyl ester carboxylesterase